MAKTLFLALSLFLLIQTQASNTLDWNQGIDPGTITWWQETWTRSPVQSSRSNGGSNNVTFTFHFRPTTSLDDGVIQLLFPKAFIVAGANSDNMIQINDVSLKGGEDQQLSVSGITLPKTNKAYGPIGILTKHSSTSQIVDVNLTFASYYVTEPVNSFSSITITPYQNDSVTILESVSLNFRFTISIDMWEHDVFVIYTDDDWTTPIEPTCESLDETTQLVNNFRANDGTPRLDCVADPENRRVYIYGLGNDIDVSQLGGDSKSVDIRLKVGRFRAPIADYTSDNYDWRIEIWRAGTTTALAQFNGKGPETDPGIMSVSRWKPHNGFSPDNIVQGFTTYMNVVVITTNPIPALGRIELNYSNVNIHSTIWAPDNTGQVASSANNAYCFVEWAGISNTCTTTAGKVTIEFNSELPAGTILQVSTLTNFNGSNPQVSAISYVNKGTTVIDNSNAASITYNTTGNIKQAYQFQFYVSTTGGTAPVTVNSYTTYAGHQLRAGLKLKSSEFSSETLTVFDFYAPLSIGYTGDFGFYVNDSPSVTHPVIEYKLLQSSDSLQLAPDAGQVNAFLDYNYFKYPLYIDLNGQSGATFLFRNGDSSLTAPAVSSNRETRQEAVGRAVVGSVAYFRFQTLYFGAGSMQSVTVTRRCLDLYRFDIQTEANTTIDTTITNRSYYLEIMMDDFLQDFDSGLTVGEAYPFQILSQFDSDISITTTSANTKGTFLIQGQDIYTKNQIHSFVTAFGGSQGTNQANFSFYFVRNDGDPSLKYIISTDSAVNITNSGLTAASTFELAAKDYQISQNTTFSNQSVAGFTQNTNDLIIAQFPEGFMVSSESDFKLNGVSQETVYYLSSNDTRFKYPAVFVVGDNALNDVITVTNVVTSPYEKLNFQAITGNGLVCGDNSNILNVVRGTFSDIQGEPKESYSRCADTFDTTLKIDFRTQNAVIQGAQIYVRLDTRWKINGECQFEGIYQIDDNTEITCEKSGLDWVVSNFAKIPAGSEIQLKFTRSFPPENLSNDQLFTGHVDSIVTQITIGGTTHIIDSIYEYSDLTFESVAPCNPGEYRIYQNSTFPPNAEEKDVEAYIQFSFNKLIPKDAVITITSPVGKWNMPDGKLSEYVYFSRAYKSVSVSDDKLQITVANDITESTVLEIYIEMAFDNPAESNKEYDIKVTYHYVTIIQGKNSDTSDDQQYLNVVDKLENSVADNQQAIQSEIYNAGELATYSIAFYSTIEYERDDMLIIQFPRQFDYYLGKTVTQERWYFPNRHFIDCDSKSFGDTTTCVVDRRRIYISGSLDVQLDLAIFVNIYNIRNPNEQETDEFQIYHADSMGVPKAGNRGVEGVSIQKHAGNIQVKSIEIDDHNLFGDADYKVSFYASLLASDTTEIIMKLPKQYDTKESRADRDISCELSFIDYDDGILEPTEEKITEEQNCRVERNSIIASLPRNYLNVFDMQTRIIFEVKDLKNPQWGMLRERQNNFTWDFDANDDYAFTIYDQWTDQFEFYAYDTQKFIYNSRSYLNANQAYLGFEGRLRNFVVNSYSPITQKNFIRVTPGLQTQDLYITSNVSGEQIASRQVIFQPTTSLNTIKENQLTFKSKTDFHIFYGDVQMQFRVGAASSISTGLYYIDWTIIDDFYDQQQEPIYLPPYKTLVEVNNAIKSTFTVGDIFDVPIGKSTPPVKIEIDYSPNHQVKVDFTIESGNKNLILRPTSVTFTNDQNVKYFTIEVNPNYKQDLELGQYYTTEIVQFSISGQNSASFNQISNKSFKIYPRENAPSQPSQILSFSALPPTKTTIQLKAKSDADGEFIYFVAPIGSPLPNLSTLIRMVGDAFELDEQVAYNIDYQVPETLPSGIDNQNTRNDPWINYKRRMYKNHLQDYWYGSAVGYKNVEVDLVKLTNLFAYTEYNAWVAFKNVGNYWSDFSHIDFTTKEYSEAIKILLSFPGEVTENWLTKLKDLVGNTLGVVRNRLLNGQMESFRRLQTETTGFGLVKETIFTWDLPEDRSIEGPTPATIATISDEQNTYLQKGLQDLGITLKGSLSFKAQLYEAFKAPNWARNNVPSLNRVSQTSISAQMKQTIPGECCCVALNNNDTYPNALQILLSLDQQNQDAKGQCANVVDTNENVVLEIKGLAPSTAYHIFCMAYNEYILWPTEIITPRDEFQAYFTASTLTITDPDVEEDDSAVWMQFAMAIVILLSV